MDLHQSIVSKCMLVNQMYDELKLSLNNDVPPQKSESLAAIQRSTGNDYYRNGDYGLALKYYCKTLLIAPPSSPEYSRAFGNRSAALYMLGQYEICIVDIERALTHGYDENSRPKLMKRMSSCKEILSKRPIVADPVEEAQNKLFSKTGKGDGTIVSANVPMSIRKVKTNKRQIVCDEDVPAGQLIALEKPYAFHLAEAYTIMRCYNCCARSDGMIPCDYCACAMFCDEECRDESWEAMHKWVCPFISILANNVANVDFVALNCVLKSRSDKNSWTEFFESVKSSDSSVESLYATGFVVNAEGRLVFDSGDYSAVYTLATERNSTSTEKLFTMASSAAIFVRFLEKYSTFFDDAPKEPVNHPAVAIDKYRFLTGGLILHNIMIALSNPIQVAGLTPNSEKVYVDLRFGYGMYPLCSLMTHSCSPNMSVVFKDNKAALIAITPIKKDQPFSISFGGHYTVQTLETRQKHLKTTLQLVCECEACVNNWPLQTDLPTGSFNKFSCTFRNILSLVGLGGKVIKFEDIATVPTIVGLKTGDRVLAVQVLQKLCDGITYLDEYKPCQEFAIYQNLLRLTLALLGNIVPEEDFVVISYPEDVIKKYNNR